MSMMGACSNLLLLSMYGVFYCSKFSRTQGQSPATRPACKEARTQEAKGKRGKRRQKAKEAKGGKRQKRQKAKGGKRGRGKNSPGQKHWLHPAQKAQQQKVSCLPPQLRLPMISRPQHCHRLPPSLQTLTHSSHSPVDSLARLSLVH